MKILLLFFILWFTFSSFTYPENFNHIMKSILLFEGGFSDILDDPGGATNFGITQETYDIYRKRNKLQKQSVKYIKMTEVYDCYYKNYYLKAGCDTLPPALSFVNMDVAVNFGIGGANRFIDQLIENNSELAENIIGCDKELSEKYIDIREEYRYRITAANKKKCKFLNGWLNRDEQVRKIIRKSY